MDIARLISHARISNGGMCHENHLSIFRFIASCISSAEFAICQNKFSRIRDLTISFSCAWFSIGGNFLENHSSHFQECSDTQNCSFNIHKKAFLLNAGILQFT